MKRLTKRNAEKVFQAMLDLVLENKHFMGALNGFLDELLEDDFFGTEGQRDPRGDHRE